MATVLAGCPGSEPAPPPPAEPSVGTLAFDLPAGVSVSVDDEPRGVTPLAPLQLSAASHRVVLRTACDEVEQAIAIQPAAEMTLDRAATSGLGFATVQIAATTIRDEALPVKLHAGDTEVPGDDGRFEIPACPIRMRVEPTGSSAYNLGSFIEDIEPKAGETVTRNLVLRPGPDVVRLHGGPFKQGPHPKDSAEDPRTPLPPKRVVVEAFDMDRTEVTARQYMDCLGERRCEKQPGHVRFRDFCVFELSGLTGIDASVFGRRMIEGKEDLPANCVNIIEAQSYCEWRGMRLPTPLEFDYAFRSGKSEYIFPWGTDDSECRSYGVDEPACVEMLEFHGSERGPTYQGKRWRFNPQPACSFVDGRGTSEQGICDLAGNLLEFAVFPADFDDEKRHYALGSERVQRVAAFVMGSLPGTSEVGFRCVAPVKDGGER
jgi:formylglycine-generating enzyme required for sulfatase activity